MRADQLAVVTSACARAKVHGAKPWRALTSYTAENVADLTNLSLGRVGQIASAVGPSAVGPSADMGRVLLSRVLFEIE